MKIAAPRPRPRLLPPHAHGHPWLSAPPPYARPAKVGGVWETARGGLLRRWAYRRCAPSAVRRRDLLVHGCTGQEHAARRLGAADPAPRAGSGQDALPAEEVGQEHLLELWGQFCARQLVE